MDEVGFMVSNITEKGFIKIIPVGGIKPETYVSQNMQIIIDDNTTIRGIIASTPPHLSKEPKAVNVDDLVLDVGADSKEHALSMGIQIGMQVVSVNDYYFTYDNKKIVSKAWDNRFGCGLAIEVMRYATSHKHPNTIYAGASVQEEVGCRGAVTLSNMIEPDFFLAFDVTTATDCMPPNDKTGSALGKGFIVRFFDPGCLMNTSFKKYIENLATKNDIKYQLYAPSGGTDASKGQYAGSGCISTCLAICGRYIHSTATMIHMKLFQHTRFVAHSRRKSSPVKFTFSQLTPVAPSIDVRMYAKLTNPSSVVTGSSPSRTDNAQQTGYCLTCISSYIWPLKVCG